MAMGMREIVGQNALTCSLCICLNIQPLDSPSLLLAHVRDDFEIVLPYSSLLVSVTNVD